MTWLSEWRKQIAHHVENFIELIEEVKQRLELAEKNMDLSIQTKFDYWFPKIRECKDFSNETAAIRIMKGIFY